MDRLRGRRPLAVGSWARTGACKVSGLDVSLYRYTIFCIRLGILRGPAAIHGNAPVSPFRRHGGRLRRRHLRLDVPEHIRGHLGDVSTGALDRHTI